MEIKSYRFLVSFSENRNEFLSTYDTQNQIKHLSIFNIFFPKIIDKYQ